MLRSYSINVANLFLNDFVVINAHYLLADYNLILYDFKFQLESLFKLKIAIVDYSKHQPLISYFNILLFK